MCIRDRNIEYAKIESEINQLELEKTQLEQFLQDSELNYETILDKSNKLGKVIQLIDQKTIRWIELEEKEN